ncbi:MAG TPA: zf-HC2 domain-containing protein, partial [Dehalococcoidia bacterium]|nr:zf-HC2 domain-containing protein [Dehalococcoidia bacterium]
MWRGRGVAACDPARLSAYLDGELSPADQLKTRRHLAACADCRAVLDEYRTIGTVLRDLPEEPLPPGVRRRVWTQATIPARPPVRSDQRLVGGLVAAAAALALGVAGLTQYLPPKSVIDVAEEPSIRTAAPDRSAPEAARTVRSGVSPPATAEPLAVARQAPGGVNAAGEIVTPGAPARPDTSATEEAIPVPLAGVGPAAPASDAPPAAESNQLSPPAAGGETAPQPATGTLEATETPSPIGTSETDPNGLGSAATPPNMLPHAPQSGTPGPSQLSPTPTSSPTPPSPPGATDGSPSGGSPAGPSSTATPAAATPEPAVVVAAAGAPDEPVASAPVATAPSPSPTNAPPSPTPMTVAAAVPSAPTPAPDTATPVPPSPTSAPPSPTPAPPAPAPAISAAAEGPTDVPAE